MRGRNTLDMRVDITRATVPGGNGYLFTKCAYGECKTQLNTRIRSRCVYLFLNVYDAPIQEQQREYHSTDHNPEVNCIPSLYHTQQRAGESKSIRDIEYFGSYALSTTVRLSYIHFSCTICVAPTLIRFRWSPKSPSIELDKLVNSDTICDDLCNDSAS